MNDKYRHQVEIKPVKHVGISISNTHNDSQWSSINVKDVIELKQLRDAIDDYMDSAPKD